MYVMWTDGESDTPPLTYIVYFIRAIVVAVSFPYYMTGLFKLLLHLEIQY